MTYNVKITWTKKSGESFVDNKYNRSHIWSLDGGLHIDASSSPQVVPLPMSKESAIDPEEAFVASLSSCHMLWFLSNAAGKKFVVESYEDAAKGTLGKNEDGKMAMMEVVLKPKIDFSVDNIPSDAQVDEMHSLAHHKCYIANSVKTIIKIVKT